MSDGAVMILVDGSVMTRSQVVESLGYAQPWRTYAIEGARLIRLGTDAATLVYTAHADRDDVEPARVARQPVRRCGKSADCWNELSESTCV